MAVVQSVASGAQGRLFARDVFHTKIVGFCRVCQSTTSSNKSAEYAALQMKEDRQQEYFSTKLWVKTLQEALRWTLAALRLLHFRCFHFLHDARIAS